MSDTLLIAENVSKKFCLRLKRSLWYAVKDLGSEIVGCKNSHKKSLRKDEFWAVRNVSFRLKRGDTIALIGPNGAGKTTLLRMLSGLIKPDTGCIEVRGRMQALIALGAGFNPILTGRENIYINASVLGISKTEVDRKFKDISDFSGIGEFIDTPVQNYSSGMRVRLGFSVAVHVNPDILLVDEILAVGDWGFQRKCFNKIGELRQNGTAIILVSHNMQVVSTFSEKVLLLTNQKHTFFENVGEGIKAYNKLFSEKGDSDITKICNGTDKITFNKIDIKQQEFYPGDSFIICMHYESLVEYSEVQIDTKIMCSNEPEIYFQATNKAYNKKINLQKGKHVIKIKVENIPINNSDAIISISIWAKKRAEALFWWRIPLKFKGIGYSAGKNFLNMLYEVN